MQEKSRIKDFPISFFSVIMGMTGFTIALQKSEEILKNPVEISSIVLWITLFFLALIIIAYVIKLIKYSHEVRQEFNHPTRLSFFPAFSISLLLISVAFLSVDISVSKYFWIAGTLIHFLFTLKIISIWIQHTQFEVKHLSPAWFIPAVGNIIVPIAGVNHFSPEISWFFFSIGLMFWIILLILFFNRAVFHAPLPDKLLPTLFILIAPPSVGFISYVKLSNTVNDFSRILYYFGLFLFVLLVFQFKMFKRIKYYLSWWAYSFPLAALTISSILMYTKSEIPFFYWLGYGLLTILGLLILLLLIRTVYAVIKKEICVEEE